MLKLGLECRRDWAGGGFASAIGHVIGHLKDIGKACARDCSACLGILLLLGNGAVCVDAGSVIWNSDCLYRERVFSVYWYVLASNVPVHTGTVQ